LYVGPFLPPGRVTFHFSRDRSNWSSLAFAFFSTIPSYDLNLAFHWFIFYIEFQFAGDKIPHVECCFYRRHPGFNFKGTPVPLDIIRPGLLEIFHILLLLFFYHTRDLYWRWLLRDSHHLRVVTFIPFPYQLPISTSLSVVPRSNVSSIAISTRSSSHFTVRIACLPILKTQYPSGAFLVMYSLYKLNRIGDKEHSCLTPVPIFTHVHVQM
jgi:hypothetical protein